MKHLKEMEEPQEIEVDLKFSAAIEDDEYRKSGNVNTVADDVTAEDFDQIAAEMGFVDKERDRSPLGYHYVNKFTGDILKTYPMQNVQGGWDDMEAEPDRSSDKTSFLATMGSNSRDEAEEVTGFEKFVNEKEDTSKTWKYKVVIKSDESVKDAFEKELDSLFKKYNSKTEDGYVEKLSEEKDEIVQ